MNAADAILEKLNEMFPDKNALQMRDVARYMGVSEPTVKRLFGLGKGKYIDKITLAYKLAK